jgi:CRP/FNR family transcriptional regulator, anaerobic regulatory protein
LLPTVETDGGAVPTSDVEYVPCAECPLRRKALFRPFSDAELDFVGAMKTAHVGARPREHIIEAGQVGAPLMTLFEGWAIRYRRGIGGRRHILSFVLPGALVGAESALLGKAEHSVMAITPVTLCVFSGRSMAELFAAHPGLALALYRDQLETVKDLDFEAVNGSTGDAVARLAYLFLHTFDRLAARGLANGSVCPFPLKRADIADRVGLSTMHLSRSLAALKRQRLATLIDGTLHIMNRARLARLVHHPAQDAATVRALL